MQSSGQTWAAFRQADARPPLAAKSDPPRCGRSPGGAGGQTIRHTMGPRGRTGPRGRRGHLPCRRAAREGRGTSLCTRHGRHVEPCPNAARPAHPGRRAAGMKKQKKKKRRPPATAVERSVALAQVCLVVGRLEARNAAAALWVDAAYSPPLWGVCVAVLCLGHRLAARITLCRSGSPPRSSPLLQTPSIFLSEAMLGPRAGGHMQPATAACAASVHSRVPKMIRLGRQAPPCRRRRCRPAATRRDQRPIQGARRRHATIPAVMRCGVCARTSPLHPRPRPRPRAAPGRPQS